MIALGYSYLHYCMFKRCKRHICILQISCFWSNDSISWCNVTSWTKL